VSAPAAYRAEVAIVGGGPAGAATALRLAHAGMDVLVLDRADFPRPKPCGECLSPAATLLLQELGVLPDVLALGPATLRGWRIIAPAGGRMEARFDDIAGPDALCGTAIAVERTALDSALLDAARRAGARVLTPVRVNGVVTDRGVVRGVIARNGDQADVTIRARLVIGADGLRSVVARELGLVARTPRLRKLSLTAHLPAVAGLDGFGELHLGPGVCAGVAPVGEGADAACNLTIVVSEGAACGVVRGPAARFAAALALFPALQARCNGAAALDRQEIRASGPFDVPVRRVSGPGFALVGDAAGYFDPFTGQGICHALLGARRLADAVLAARSGSMPVTRALSRYARAQHRHRREAHALQRAIDCIVRSPALADRLIPAVQRSPGFRSALLGATGDLLPPRALLSPALLLTFLADNIRRGA
jgi:menaquinone-9 beta-reductase